MITPFEEIQTKCKESLNLSEPELALLPRKWELLGDVLVLRLEPGIKRHWRNIAPIYAGVLKAKAVLRRFDKIRGVYREPGVELLYGNPGNLETIHKENKVTYKFDPLLIMFSSGNIDERIRISKMANKHETVVDMFSGIGYFALPIAVHSKPQKVVACELNPVAFDYLCENIKLNKVESIVEPILGDNRKEIPHNFADRIIMGYIKSDHSHRAAAVNILKPNGGIIHYHDVGFEDEVIEQSFDKFKHSLIELEYNNRFNMELMSFYKIKSFGPKLTHAVLDIKLESI